VTRAGMLAPPPRLTTRLRFPGLLARRRSNRDNCGAAGVRGAGMVWVRVCVWGGAHCRANSIQGWCGYVCVGRGMHIAEQTAYSTQGQAMVVPVCCCGYIKLHSSAEGEAALWAGWRQHIWCAAAAHAWPSPACASSSWPPGNGCSRSLLGEVHVGTSINSATTLWLARRSHNTQQPACMS
jgi:hypothetical protein